MAKCWAFAAVLIDISVLIHAEVSVQVNKADDFLAVVKWSSEESKVKWIDIFGDAGHRLSWPVIPGLGKLEIPKSFPLKDKAVEFQAQTYEGDMRIAVWPKGIAPPWVDRDLKVPAAGAYVIGDAGFFLMGLNDRYTLVNPTQSDAYWGGAFFPDGSKIGPQTRVKCEENELCPASQDTDGLERCQIDLSKLNEFEKAGFRFPSAKSRFCLASSFSGKRDVPLQSIEDTAAREIVEELGPFASQHFQKHKESLAFVETTIGFQNWMNNFDFTRCKDELCFVRIYLMVLNSDDIGKLKQHFYSNVADKVKPSGPCNLDGKATSGQKVPSKASLGPDDMWPTEKDAGWRGTAEGYFFPRRLYNEKACEAFVEVHQRSVCESAKNAIHRYLLIFQMGKKAVQDVSDFVFNSDDPASFNAKSPGLCEVHALQEVPLTAKVLGKGVWFGINSPDPMDKEAKMVTTVEFNSGDTKEIFPIQFVTPTEDFDARYLSWPFLSELGRSALQRSTIGKSHTSNSAMIAMIVVMLFAVLACAGLGWRMMCVKSSTIEQRQPMVYLPGIELSTTGALS